MPICSLSLSEPATYGNAAFAGALVVGAVATTLFFAIDLGTLPTALSGGVGGGALLVLGLALHGFACRRFFRKPTLVKSQSTIFSEQTPKEATASFKARSPEEIEKQPFEAYNLRHDWGIFAYSQGKYHSFSHCQHVQDRQGDYLIDKVTQMQYPIERTHSGHAYFAFGDQLYYETHYPCRLGASPSHSSSITGRETPAWVCGGWIYHYVAESEELCEFELYKSESALQQANIRLYPKSYLLAINGKDRWVESDSDSSSDEESSDD